MRPRSNPGSNGTSADDSTCTNCSTAHDCAYGRTKTDDRAHNGSLKLVQCRRVKLIQRSSGCNDRAYRSGETDVCSDHRGIVVELSVLQRGFVERLVQCGRETDDRPDRCGIVQRRSSGPHGHASTR